MHYNKTSNKDKELVIMTKEKKFSHLVEGVDYDFLYQGRPAKGYSEYLGMSMDFHEGPRYLYRFIVQDVQTQEILFQSFPYTGTVKPD